MEDWQTFCLFCIPSLALVKWEFISEISKVAPVAQLNRDISALLTDIMMGRWQMLLIVHVSTCRLKRTMRDKTSKQIRSSLLFRATWVELSLAKGGATIKYVLFLQHHTRRQWWNCYNNRHIRAAAQSSCPYPHKTYWRSKLLSICEYTYLISR